MPCRQATNVAFPFGTQSNKHKHNQRNLFKFKLLAFQVNNSLAKAAALRLDLRPPLLLTTFLIKNSFKE